MIWNRKGVSADGVEIKALPEDKPEFARVYTMKLDTRATVKITMKSYSFGRSDWSELRQPNGRYVIFDMSAVADKILDPLLVPLVENACARIRALDKAFMAGDRNEFTDTTGAKWVRQ